MPTTNVASPWPNQPESEQTKVHSLIDTNCLRYIKSVCPTHGIIKSIIQRTFHAIERDLRAKGFTTFDPGQDAEILATICFCTSPRTDPTASDRHDTGTVAPVCAAHEVIAQQSTDVLETASGRGGIGGTGNRQAKESRLQKIKTASKKLSERVS